jgi:hypothetical protein
VRAATADPQASGHANRGAWPTGARRKLALTIFSKAGAIRSTGNPILTFRARRRRTTKSLSEKIYSGLKTKMRGKSPARLYL